MNNALPSEYRTPDGETEDWQTTLGFLAALERSGSPIVVVIPTGSAPGYASQQIVWPYGRR